MTLTTAYLLLFLWCTLVWYFSVLKYTSGYSKYIDDMDEPMAKAIVAVIYLTIHLSIIYMLLRRIWVG